MRELVEDVRERIRKNPNFLHTKEVWRYIRVNSAKFGIHPAVILMLIVTETQRAQRRASKCNA